MAEVEMKIIDGVRYRADEVPEHKAILEPEKPKRAPRAKAKPKAEGDESDA